jgi:hypothetical protein
MPWRRRSSRSQAPRTWCRCGRASGRQCRPSPTAAAAGRAPCAPMAARRGRGRTALPVATGLLEAAPPSCARARRRAGCRPMCSVLALPGPAGTPGRTPGSGAPGRGCAASSDSDTACGASCGSCQPMAAPPTATRCFCAAACSRSSRRTKSAEHKARPPKPLYRVQPRRNAPATASNCSSAVSDRLSAIV